MSLVQCKLRAIGSNRAQAQATHSMESRIQQLELKLMDMELTVEQLNDVIIRHENIISSLSKQIDRYEKQLRTLGTPIAKQSEETPPPHY